ncbi:hypothetical protein OF83DRAFT_1159200, partial [Amylostereum chailletii]
MRGRDGRAGSEAVASGGVLRAVVGDEGGWMTAAGGRRWRMTAGGRRKWVDDGGWATVAGGRWRMAC